MSDQMHVPATIPFPCPASTPLEEQDSEFATYVPLRVGKSHFEVSPTFHEGYLAARRAYAQMEEEHEWGPPSS